MYFNDIIGLTTVKQSLLRAAQQHQLPHALLLSGKVGSANLVLALALARYLHCEKPQHSDACGQCPSCKKYDKWAHPDLHFVFPVSSTKTVKSKPLSQEFMAQWRQFITQLPYPSLGDWLTYIGAEDKKGNISVEESRQIIRALSLKPYEGQYKILLMWLPELMNIQAANAILKVLEEPSTRTIFLLVSYDPAQLMSTIISRVQLMHIPMLEDQEVADYLVRKMDVHPEKAKELAYLADGDLNRAYHLSQQEQTDQHEYFRDWMRACYRKDLTDLVNRADNFGKMTKETQKALLNYSLRMVRESLVYRSQSRALLRAPADKVDFVQGFSKTLSFTNYEQLHEELNKTLYHLERNAQAKLAFLDLSLQLMLMFEHNK